ncbi:hypothetical protein [Roseovarius indicus]|uniref:DNA-binding transcriptional repressor LrhA n=1 Tax=Roseovarius indicus TaxID=540747 RepID=A0A0T5PBJ3_9RHOB|nr:hypothetical protein [Roseovarius indicus]KRS18665.1 hypothetical protein XM52_07825 [Roseovarius indicus]QEW25709.1 DNA-binding transcriptional repressor LrhA [Roseovarius indicus]SFD99985.1 hypothetical protein SAMN04488031_10448 [Roseovarius indicus]
MGAVLDHSQTRWRAVLTTPNLPAVWAGLRSGLGIVVRMDHGRPEDLACVGAELDLPDLPNIDVRLLRAPKLSRFAERLARVLREETLRHLGPAESQHGKR